MENENLYEYEIIKNGGNFIAVEILSKVPHKMKMLPAQSVAKLKILNQKTTFKGTQSEKKDDTSILCRGK